MTMSTANRGTLLLIVAIVLMAGCKKGYPIAPVSGRITLDGEPLAGALISFEPLRQGESLEVGYGSYGKCDDDGRYRVKSLHDEDGAIVGPHRVLITTFLGEEGPNGETIITSQERVPEKYSDYDNPIKFEVPAEGTDQANFELTTGGSKL